MIKTLRVLNVVNSLEIGIPLSIQQYKLLTPSVLIGRLVNAHQHLLALKISDYLGMTTKGISYAAVDAHADRTGRRKLAVMLVEHEPLSLKQEKENGKQASKIHMFERAKELHKIQHLSTTRGLY
nr:protein vacuoleless1 [Tanacetum cinerariifolium]